MVYAVMRVTHTEPIETIKSYLEIVKGLNLNTWLLSSNPFKIEQGNVHHMWCHYCTLRSISEGLSE